jgi:hypothetical protein
MITVNQYAAPIAAAQSPIVFSVSSPSYTGSAFQYTADVFIWSGSLQDSGSFPLYQMRKYPNQSGVGIFDFSRILQTKLQDLALENTSNLYFYKILFSEQWYTGSIDGNVIASGSEVQVDQSNSQYLRIFDGYLTYPQSINTDITDNECFPLLTDMISVTQSVTLQDTGSIGFFTGDYVGKVDDKALEFTGYYEDNSIVTNTVMATGFPDVTTEDQVKLIQIYPGGRAVGNDPFAGGFPLSTTGLKSYSIRLTGTGVTNKQVLNVEIVCQPKWQGYQVQWKNRYGQFDHLNMMNVSKKKFQTDQKVYQPQLGNWNDANLSYDTYKARTERYVVDSQETLMLNSDWLDEKWNELLKQLLVTDEIYYYDNDFADWRPMTVNTSQLDFKTRANDKLIQYTLEFAIGQPYKLIL